MKKQKNITSTPEPLEKYAKQFDEIFSKSNQREAFRCYLEGLLLPIMASLSLLPHGDRSAHVPVDLLV